VVGTGDEPADSFVDMGKIGSAGGLPVASPWVVTLDLGEGLQLTLRRG